MFRWTRAALAVLALGLMSAVADAEETQVAVAGGMLQGVERDGAIAFLGVPYAAPPVDDLRWRAPQPVEPWTGIRDAMVSGHDCMQIPFEDVVAPPGSEPSEDCLVLNVWLPAETYPVFAKVPD
jgi:para-nitrobenzyl esterase